MYFGSSRKQISIRGESATQVRVLAGWEARIATMVLMFRADGAIVSPVVVIFKGEGQRVNEVEASAYAKLLDVKVVWQKKAWIDRHVEKIVLRSQLKVDVERAQAELGRSLEALLVQDRGPGHDDPFVYSLSPHSSFP